MIAHKGQIVDTTFIEAPLNMKVLSLISIENLEANDFYNAQLLDLSKKFQTS